MLDRTSFLSPKFALQIIHLFHLDKILIETWCVSVSFAQKLWVMNNLKHIFYEVETSRFVRKESKLAPQRIGHWIKMINYAYFKLK